MSRLPLIDRRHSSRAALYPDSAAAAHAAAVAAVAAAASGGTTSGPGGAPTVHNVSQVFPFKYEETVKKLNAYYLQVKKQILRHQSCTTGLFPCDLTKTKAHIAHVRDSIYCAVCVWALSQAFKRIDDDKGKTYELGQSAVKCMRGILACWLKQADKVEKFKLSQSPKNALHVKFHMRTGDALDEEYNHLQIDCVALYLIFLVQMIQSGLQVIYTTDEVNFIQNLVFYVERAYRTPDYGMWERGSKYNNGSSELHASSVGMAKAALEIINGHNLYGENGASWSVIYVDADSYMRNQITCQTLIPRESPSKNTDVSLLPTVGWPAFALHDETLVNRTKNKIIRKLKGRYGFKRFLRDGYRTEVEDRNRKYYKPAEIKMFDGIECEWPMFYIYLIIDGIYRNDHDQVSYYQKELEPLLKVTNEGSIVPKYFYVPEESIDDERASPNSQERFPSDEGYEGLIFLWGQSLYVISQLLVEGLLHINELDPIRRYLPAADRPRPSSRYSSFQRAGHDDTSDRQYSPSDLVVQVVLIAESVRLQQMLATYGIKTQTPHQIEPIEIWPPSELSKAYEQLGVNNKLNLTGRPPRPFGGLGTSKIYRACGYTFLCYPLLFEVSDFYLSQDMQFVLDDVKSDLAFLSKCWKLAGRPTFCMIVREDNMRGPKARYIFDLLAEFKRGDCDGVKIRLGRLQEFISTACIEHLDFLTIDPESGQHFRKFSEKEMGKSFRSLTDIPKLVQSVEKEKWMSEQELLHKSTWDLKEMYNHVENLYLQTQIMKVLMDREGRYMRVNDITVEDHIENLYGRAGSHLKWSVVRFCASLLGKVVDSLAPSITAILVRGKQVTIGVYGHEEEVIDKPMSPSEIKAIIYNKCYPYDISQTVLQQELLINMGRFMSTKPEHFRGILKIRIGWVVQAMRLELSYSEEKETNLYALSPSAIKKLLLQILQKTPQGKDHRSPIWNRQLDGALNRVPKEFYDRVWGILNKSPGGIKASGYHLPQQPTLSDMTEYELNFSLLVEQMLSKIVDPAYRQMVVETFMVVATLLDRNPEVTFPKTVDIDKLVHEAFELFQKDQKELGHEKMDNMDAFYNTPPNIKHGTTSYVTRAVVNNLLDGDIQRIQAEMCSVS